MKKISIPDELLKLYGISEELLSQRALFLLVLDLLKQGKISSGKAMQLLGISRDDMINIMDEYDIPSARYSYQELEHEMVGFA